MRNVRTFAGYVFALAVVQHAHAASASTVAGSAVAASAMAPTSASVAPVGKDEPPLDGAVSDGARLALMQKRIPMLEAEKRIAELEKAIREANGSASPPVSALGLPPGIGGPSHHAQVPALPPLEPGAGFVEVKGIDSYNGKFSATLASGGRVDDVHVGDTFAGWRVARIGSADVTLTRKRAGRTETRVVRY
ncbi:hypothetical protein [Burkholderia pseudomultivorans]|uniref:hypothetical protein n=1 Tax=Burkholderia pseudomultivorans TaxID=1207504 RepID=UPI0012DA0C12|nr:hypothetical protein [Burkholderia pseudomultivorans]